MNKNFKIIQVHGLSGFLIFGFIAAGIFCGFIMFPIWLIMNLWNIFISNNFHLPVINYFQSLLLWMAVILSLYLILRNSISIKIQKEEDFDYSELKNIVGEFQEEDDKNKENNNNK